MKYTIRAEWTVEVDSEQMAMNTLAHIENEAARKNCELEESQIEDEDGNVLEVHEV